MTKKLNKINDFANKVKFFVNFHLTNVLKLPIILEKVSLNIRAYTHINTRTCLWSEKLEHFFSTSYEIDQSPEMISLILYQE